MPALEMIVGQVTAPDTTLTALTMNVGNSLTVRNTNIDSKIHLISMWALNNADGIFRIRSPRLHDNVQGIRMGITAAQPDPLIPKGFMQPLIPQDTLVAELSGSGTAGHIETGAALIFYEDLPGIQGNFISPEDVKNRLVNLLTVENDLTLGTAGGYDGEEALNADYDLLRANTNYAILGYVVQCQCAAVRWRGSDFGNLGVGGPGNQNSKQFTANWFVWLSELTGIPMIPVFNSANAGSILVDAVQDQTGNDVVLSTILAQLSD